MSLVPVHAALAALCATSALLACADPGDTCTRITTDDKPALVDHDLWTLASAALDPWADARPADITCDPTGRQPEDFAGTYSFTVDTALCPYTTVTQQTLTDLCAGEHLLVWLWRFALTGPEGASAHIAVQIGDEPVFEDVIPIPAPSGLKALSYPVTRSHPAGTPIFFHVRNHGNNTYQLLALARCQGECRPD